MKSSFDDVGQSVHETFSLEYRYCTTIPIGGSYTKHQSRDDGLIFTDGLIEGTHHLVIVLGDPGRLR